MNLIASEFGVLIDWDMPLQQILYLIGGAKDRREKRKQAAENASLHNRR
jgi:hypothetical protein